MSLDLKEQLFVENKIGNPSSPTWTWAIVRAVAALYNSGGGILRVGMGDDGKPVGVNDPLAYAADKSALATTLHDYLDPVPPFEPKDKKRYVEIVVRDGVTAPCVLRQELTQPQDPRDKRLPKKYPIGTVFVRRMNGAQPSSEPPQNRSDWQTALHLWETNRGVTVQGHVIVQFSLLVNEWNPFDQNNTHVTLWRANCLADVAGPLGRKKLRDGLKAIIADMRLSPKPPSSGESQDKAGSDYKQPIAQRIERLCEELGLSPPK